MKQKITELKKYDITINGKVNKLVTKKIITEQNLEGYYYGDLWLSSEFHYAELNSNKLSIGAVEFTNETHSGLLDEIKIWIDKKFLCEAHFTEIKL